MRRVPLLIFGAGNVGRALVSQLLAAAALHEARHGLLLPIVAWCDRHTAMVEEAGLSEATLRAAAAAQASGGSLAQVPPGGRQDDLSAIVDVAGTEGCIVVDVTASDETVPALEDAVRRGYGVVTANKIPLVGPQAVFDRLAGSGRCRYETTVGSAVPVIEALHGLLRAADPITSIQGLLSGTLGFLFSGLQGGPGSANAFSARVREAMRRGYTEPDPRIDLGGQDVARKALILARTMGWRMEMPDVALASLVPPHLAGLPLSGFLAGLPDLDAEYAALVDEAAGRGEALRYIADLAAGKVTVGLQAVPAESSLGRLQGNDNLLAFRTRYYPDQPLVLQGRGAGVDAAAAGVHSDIIALARGAAHWPA